MGLIVKSFKHKHNLLQNCCKNKLENKACFFLGIMRDQNATVWSWTARELDCGALALCHWRCSLSVAVMLLLESKGDLLYAR